MMRVEKHVIKPSSAMYREADAVCFASKNLYNASLYQQRQAFFQTGKVLSYVQLNARMKGTEAYQALPAKVSQQVLMQVCQNWTSYVEATAEYGKHPEKFLAAPRIPNYQPKTDGRNVVVYTQQAISRKALKRGLIRPSGTTIRIETQVSVKYIQQVRLVPKRNTYVVEVVYDVPDGVTTGASERILGIDLGIENFAAIASNVEGLRPQIVHGRGLKGLNAAYNRHKAKLQAALPEGQHTSRQIQQMTEKRNRQVDDYLHKASRYIVNLCLEHRIDTIVIGKNELWKQSINLGRVTNQNFTNIPHARLIEMVSYKCQAIGIRVVVIEESYTSKCSFLDGESIEKHETYAGKRIHRGLFRSKDGFLINADINAALNLIRKAFPNACGLRPFTPGNGIRERVVAPVRVTPGVSQRAAYQLPKV